jgi:hypothetical protein
MAAMQQAAQVHQAALVVKLLEAQLMVELQQADQVEQAVMHQAATVDQQAQAEQAVMQEAVPAVTQQVDQVALAAVLTAMPQEQQPTTRSQHNTIQ